MKQITATVIISIIVIFTACSRQFRK